MTQETSQSEATTALEVVYRPARQEDMEPALHLWGRMMEEHEANDPRIQLASGALGAYRAYVGYHLTHLESFVQVAEVNRSIVGFMLLTISRNLPMFLPARYGYLSDLVVAAPYRGRGIGGELLERGVEWLRSQGISTIQLQYYQFNERGGSFWRNHGFTPYYTRMWRELE